MLSLTAMHKTSICGFIICKGPIQRLETNVRLGQFIKHVSVGIRMFNKLHFL